jgi:hypothetical protein
VRLPPATHPGRPNSNGCVERAQLTILEECWRPTFARSLLSKVTALTRDLDGYLTEYNHDHAHTGRLTKDACPQTSSMLPATPVPDKGTHLSTQLGVRTR